MVKLKQTLLGLFSVTLLSFGGWLTILFNVDPLKADNFTFFILYLSLFLFMVGIVTFISFGLRIVLGNREIIYAHFIPSLRQSVLIAFGLVGLLFLQSLRVLSLVDAAAFLLAVLLLELFFRTKRQKDRTLGPS